MNFPLKVLSLLDHTRVGLNLHSGRKVGWNGHPCYTRLHRTGAIAEGAMNCADAHNRTGNSIHGEGGTLTRNHDSKHQFTTRSVKSFPFTAQIPMAKAS